MKLRIVLGYYGESGRAPHGARGLKRLNGDMIILHSLVAPRMGRVD